MDNKHWQWRFAAGIDEIPAAEWDLCLAEDGQTEPDNPFCRHAFLKALEQSGSVCAAAGWQPMHLQLFCNDRRLAVMPLYLKEHSWGEYVFDWAWADAYQRHGEAYYPKLVCAIPFTPVTGPRLGIAPEARAAAADIQQALGKLFWQLLESYSSWHWLFVNEVQLESLRHLPQTLVREGTQFHWFNRGYSNFDDFLARLNSKRRKNILKERRALAGLQFVWLRGDELQDWHWQLFYRCYRQTYLKRSGHRGYLQPDFFKLLGKLMAAEVRLLLVHRLGETPQQALACALYLQGKDTLYGRYWGALEEIPALHFEACYWQGIDYCIENGLSCFNAGAQGEHKLIRGFECVTTYSLHGIAHPGFREAIADFCQTEAGNNRLYQAQLQQALPYKKGD
ncbi:MAG: GNAT family N-acetyltransferase [Shewanella algae]